MPVLHDAAGRQRWITVTEENHTRYLYLDGCEEGAMALASERPVFNYLWFTKCSHLIGRPLHRALVLGAGAFTASKCLAIDHLSAIIDSVDEEPELATIGRRFFRLDRPEFTGIRFHGVSAEEFLTGQPGSYDFIFDDLFDGFQHVPIAGRGSEHMRSIRSLLPDGVYVKNLIWSPRSADSRAACVEAITACKAVFPTHAVLILGDPAAGHNVLLIGLTMSKSLDWPEMCSCLETAHVPHAILDQVVPES